MAIYTRGGDAGQTGLADGSRTSKASARIEANGALDEAGAVLGWARVALDTTSIGELLQFAQHRLFNCSAALADPSASAGDVSASDVAFLERAIDALQGQSAPWGGFVLASGGEAATRLHVARTVCRRAERRVVELAESEAVDPLVLAFLNRLSDLLFAAADAAASADGRAQEPWLRDAEPPAL